jgi:serine/threonine-protein kinase RsbW
MAREDEEEVRLAVPATPEFLRLARITAAGLASRLGFTLDEVEDLRLAIDELCFSLTGPHGRAGRLELCYLLRDGTIEIRGDGRFADSESVPGASRLSTVILDALVDEHELNAEEGHARFRLVKRRTSPATSGT